MDTCIMTKYWNNHDKKCEVALRPADAPHTCSCWERERIAQLEEATLQSIADSGQFFTLTEENKLLTLRVKELEKALGLVRDVMVLSIPDYIRDVLAPCQVQPLSSRMCERGTKSCEVKHMHFYPKDN
jgi:hypothetical protein